MAWKIVPGPVPSFLDFMAVWPVNLSNPRKDVLFDPPPGPEAGGQRPTARCALGRKSVWNIVLALRRDILGRHHPPTGRANARPMTGSGGRSSIPGQLA